VSGILEKARFATIDLGLLGVLGGSRRLNVPAIKPNQCLLLAESGRVDPEGVEPNLRRVYCC
jgi:hypothetical protein